MRTRKIGFKLIVAFLFFNLNMWCQNVGIGTSAPTEKLQVEGNILTDTVKLNAMLLTPNAGVGKILTSDEVGNASWQDNMATNTTTNLDHADGNEGFGIWGDCSTYPNISGYHPVSESKSEAWSGSSVAISGNFAIVGAPFDKIDGVSQGSAAVYFYNGSAWVLMQKLVDPEGGTYDRFGISVAISANYVMVGASYDDVEGVADQGSVCCFLFDGTSWVFTEKIIDPEGALYDLFGIDVALSGDNAVIGAYADNEAYSNQGSASIFQFNGSNWVFAQKLTDPLGSADDYFGTALAMNGDFIMVTCPGDDVTNGNQENVDQGSVCVFQFNGTNWDFNTKILDSPQAYSNFGNAISLDGNYMVVGSSSYGNNNDGQASIYWYNGTAWVLNVRLSQPPSDTEENFGSDVAISGPYVLVGVGNDVTFYGRVGSASLFFRVGNKWTRLQFILDAFPQIIDYFGGSVAINSTGRFLIGAPGFNNYIGKAVFGKIK